MTDVQTCKSCDRPIGGVAEETDGLCPRCVKAGKKGKKASTKDEEKD